MPLRHVDIDPRAGRKAQKAYRWLARRSAWAAQHFQTELNRVAQRIATSAEQGVPFLNRYRWMRVRRYSYVVYYEIRDPLPVLV